MMFPLGFPALSVCLLAAGPALGASKLEVAIEHVGAADNFGNMEVTLKVTNVGEPIGPAQISVECRYKDAVGNVLRVNLAHVVEPMATGATAYATSMIRQDAERVANVECVPMPTTDDLFEQMLRR